MRRLRREEGAVQRRPDVNSPLVTAAQLEAERCFGPAQDSVHLRAQCIVVVGVNHLDQIAAGEIGLSSAEHPSKRRIDLQDASLRRYEHHADSRVRERRLKTVFALPQLREMARRLGCSPLRRRDALRLYRPFVYQASEIDMECREERRYDGSGGEDHRELEPPEYEVQQASDRAASRVCDAKPGMIAQRG